MEDKRAWLSSWCKENIKFHRTGLVRLHCKHCHARIASETVVEVFETDPELANASIIADVVGVMFPQADPHKREILIELQKFRVKHDESDASRLAEFILSALTEKKLLPGSDA